MTASPAPLGPKHPTNTIETRGRTWRSLWLAIAVTALNAALIQFVGFVSLGPIHFLLEISSDLGVLCLCVLAVGILFGLVVAIVRLRLRRVISLGCAMASMPLIMLTVFSVPVFSPYYWYVMVNQSRFESAVKAAKQPKGRAFIILGMRDVSTGSVINPPTFASIVYDQSDELERTPVQQSPEWKAHNHSYSPTAYSAHHLYGRFYLVWSTDP